MFGAVRRIAELIEGTAGHSSLDSGELAELRRLDNASLSAPAFWRIVVGELEPRNLLPHRSGQARVESETRWGAILQAMAILRGLLATEVPLGEALAAASVTELRVSRLLRERGPTLLDTVRTVARHLASKRQRVDPLDLARLIDSDEADWRQTVRQTIARDYYRAVYRRDNPNTTAPAEDA